MVKSSIRCIKRLTIATTIANNADMSSKPTRWEIAVYDRTGANVKALGFTRRQTRSMLMTFARDNGEFIMTLLTDVEADQEWSYHHRNGITFGNGACRVAFTGRTERMATQ